MSVTQRRHYLCLADREEHFHSDYSVHALQRACKSKSSFMQTGRTSPRGQTAGSDEFVCINPEGEEIVQIAQGRNHILMLTSSGKVYAMGDNSFSQVYAERQQDSQLPAGERKSIDAMSKSGTEMTPSYSGMSGMGGGGTTMNNDKFSEYQENPRLVAFDDYNSKSLYKVHAFNNTSMAIDRSGDLYFWGEDTLRGADIQHRNVKFPQLLSDISGLRLTKDSSIL